MPDLRAVLDVAVYVVFQLRLPFIQNLVNRVPVERRRRSLTLLLLLLVLVLALVPTLCIATRRCSQSTI